VQHLLEETVVVQQGDGLAAVGAIGVVEHQEQAVGGGGGVQRPVVSFRGEVGEVGGYGAGAVLQGGREEEAGARLFGIIQQGGVGDGFQKGDEVLFALHGRIDGIEVLLGQFGQ